MKITVLGMSPINFGAISLIALLGIAHPALGEYLIFRHLRKNGQWTVFLAILILLWLGR